MNNFKNIRASLIMDEKLKREALQKLLLEDQTKRQQMNDNMNLAVVAKPMPDRAPALDVSEEDAIAHLDQALQGGMDEVNSNRKKFKNIFGQM